MYTLVYMSWNLWTGRGSSLSATGKCVKRRFNTCNVSLGALTFQYFSSSKSFAAWNKFECFTPLYMYYIHTSDQQCPSLIKHVLHVTNIHIPTVYTHVIFRNIFWRLYFSRFTSLKQILCLNFHEESCNVNGLGLRGWCAKSSSYLGDAQI